MVFTQTEGSIEQQAANMQAALARKPDALITSIVDNKAFDQTHPGRPHAGVIVIAANVDDTEGAAGNARRPSSARASFPPATRWPRRSRRTFPKDGPIIVLVGVSAPGQNWSEQRAAGVMKFLEESRRPIPDREVIIERIDSGTDLALTADRIGAYLHAIPTRPPISTPASGHAAVAQRAEGSRRPPGKVLLGGFDLVPEVLQQMKAGYVQVQVDQQPYMQGFMPVMEAYLAKTAGLAPADIDTGRASSRPTRLDAIMALSQEGPALIPSLAGSGPAAPSRGLPDPEDNPHEAAAQRSIWRSRNFAGLALLVVLIAVFQSARTACFLSARTVAASSASCRKSALSRSASRC
jgi:simple sugar transport system substrate-binding protein